MTAPARFRQSDIRRAVKSLDGLGYEEVRVAVSPDGKIEIIARKNAEQQDGVDLD